MTIYLVEITAAKDAAGTLTTLYYSNNGFLTQPSDTPANQSYLPRLTMKSPISVRREMFSRAATAGRSQIGYGNVVLVNPDGGLDPLLAYSFDKRTLKVLTGPDGTAYSSLTLALKATIDQALFTLKDLTFQLRDRLAELDLPHLTTYYGGTNSLPNGVDGTANDIKGKVIPRVYGTVFNISPPQVNSSRLEYQVSAAAVNSVTVYDNGVALTAGAAYTNQSDMETNAPAAGNYRVWAAGGMFRLGSTPAGVITADVVESGTAANMTAAQILKTMALAAGISSGDISSADVTALDTANSSVVGIYVDSDSITTLTGMDAIANSVGAYYGFDRTGTLRMARLEAPSGSPVAQLDNTNTSTPEKQQTEDGLPAWRVALNHSKYYTQQAQTAGAVSAARRAIISQQWRSAENNDSSVKTQYLLARTLTRDTLLTTSSDATTEAARLLTLFKVRRDQYKVTVNLSATLIAALDLGQVVNLTWSRFGMSAGKLFRIISIDADLGRNRADLVLWG